jgi:NmrA-like family
VIKTDYSKESLVSNLQGIDAVVSFLSHAGDAQATLIEAAVAAGVKRFLPSEFGHDTANPEVTRIIPILAGKRAIVELLQKQPTITWTAVSTSVFFDFCFVRGITGIDVKNAKATIWDEGTVPFAATNLPLIGRTIVKLLTDPAAYEESKNAYIYTASHITTQAELLALTEKITGKKFEVTHINGLETLKENEAKIAKGDFSAVLPLLQATAFTKIDGKAFADIRPKGLFNEKYGVTDVSLEEDLKKLI